MFLANGQKPGIVGAGRVLVFAKTGGAPRPAGSTPWGVALPFYLLQNQMKMLAGLNANGGFGDKQ